MHKLLQTHKLVLSWLGVGALAVVLGCGGEPQKSEESHEVAREEHVVVAEFINPDDSLSHLRYLDDGQVSLNDRCAVRKVRLNAKMPPLYVNGRPVGFC